MRCIETRFRWGSSYRPPEINYNMRCIETKISAIFCNENNDKLQHEMYWNNFYKYKSTELYKDKLQHEMYWNQADTNGRKIVPADKLQHEMYWNVAYPYYGTVAVKDKLQHEMYWNNFDAQAELRDVGINYNMRCIETKRSWRSISWWYG